MTLLGFYRYIGFCFCGKWVKFYNELIFLKWYICSVYSTPIPVPSDVLHRPCAGPRPSILVEGELCLLDVQNRSVQLQIYLSSMISVPHGIWQSFRPFGLSFRIFSFINVKIRPTIMALFKICTWNWPFRELEEIYLWTKWKMYAAIVPLLRCIGELIGKKLCVCMYIYLIVPGSRTDCWLKLPYMSWWAFNNR